MSTLIFVFIFLLGTLIGSFLNVVIYRFGSGRSVVKGRSVCMTCDKTLRWYELIPVFSFLIQRGRCRRCAAKISHQYPLVELGTGVVFTLIAWHFLSYAAFAPLSFIFLTTVTSFLFCLLIVIIVYDIRHKIIPDTLVYTYAFVAFLCIFINTSGAGISLGWPTLGAFLAGPLCALPFALLWLISKGKWMGLGDAKLIVGIGWMLGVSQTIVALTLAFWIGAVVSLLIMFFGGRRITMKTQIPFAPFLVIGLAVTFFCNLTIFSLANLFH